MKKFLPLTIVMFLSVSLSGSCKNDSPGSVTPDISVNSTSVQVSEDAPDGLATISVILSAASNRKVTVEYSTADSTATAGKDYTAVTRGTLVFNPGEISKDIKISIIPDGDMKQDVYFKLTLSNPENGVIKSPKTTIKIINVDFATLVWSDEFNSATLNTSVWNYEQGASGWGNNELENYTNSTDNVHIDSGYLHITALNPSGSSYTSGRITTAGKREFTYGRADIRAELPEGKGIWPALWMLGSNFATAGWPKCGEIDIMELLGQYPSLVHGSVHWDANGHQSRTSDYTLPGAKFSSGFHIFSLIWTPNTLKWLVDNQQYCYLSRSEISGFPFDLPQFFIFNVAVGGNWPGSPDESTVFPQNMIVDYIRVYQ
jgi:hypothetical protein